MVEAVIGDLIDGVEIEEETEEDSMVQEVMTTQVIITIMDWIMDFVF